MIELQLLPEEHNDVTKHPIYVALQALCHISSEMLVPKPLVAAYDGSFGPEHTVHQALEIVYAKLCVPKKYSLGKADTMCGVSKLHGERGWYIELKNVPPEYTKIKVLVSETV